MNPPEPASLVASARLVPVAESAVVPEIEMAAVDGGGGGDVRVAGDVGVAGGTGDVPAPIATAQGVGIGVVGARGRDREGVPR